MRLKNFLLKGHELIGVRLDENGMLYDAYLKDFQSFENIPFLNLDMLRGIRYGNYEFATIDEIRTGFFIPKSDTLPEQMDFIKPVNIMPVTKDFKREVELDMFDWYYNYQDKVLYVEGARQTGKTYTVNKFIEKVWGSEGVYKVNLMSEQAKRALEQFKNRPFQPVTGNVEKNYVEEFAEFYFSDFHIDTAKVLYIDEVQEDVGIYNMIREFARQKKCRLIVSGSYLNIVSQAKLGNNAFKPPAGGDYRITMKSLSFLEFLQANGIINMQVLYKTSDVYTEEERRLFEQVQELYHVYLRTGGYPAVVKEYIDSRSIEQAQSVLIDLVESYFLESKPYLSLCRPTVEFEGTFSAILEIMMNVNSRYKLKDIAVELKEVLKRSRNGISTDDICSTLDWLESGGFVHPIRKYTDTAFRNYAIHQRYYFADLGIVNYIAKYRSNIPDSELNGYLAENFAYLQIEESYARVPRLIGYMDILKDREIGNAELDFVYKSIQGEFVGVEVKYKNTAAKSLNKIRKCGILKKSVKVIDAMTDFSGETIPVFLLRFYCLLSHNGIFKG